MTVRYGFLVLNVLKKLGYTKGRNAVARHCPHALKRGVGVQTGFKADGTPSYQTVEKTFIPEGDLYRLIIRSELDSAQRFESWVFDEVLPSIRKHGAYVMPDLLEELQRNTEKNAALLSQLAKEQRSRLVLEEKNKELQKLAGDLRKESDLLLDKNKELESAAKASAPKVSYYDIIMRNPATLPVTLNAKDYGYSAKDFNAMLHDFGIQFRIRDTWALYQQYAGNGYTHDNVYTTRDTQRTVNHMCWTQKGRRFLYDFLKGEGIIPMIER